ncbi:MAG: hypothetical protein HYX20_04100 [Candidatus Yanofskybacteria bacterium]|nr:hypothetical protein [Candidatus Yanofskybacteria bacterium]
MKPGIQYPKRQRCPRCRSGDIFEIRNYPSLAVEKYSAWNIGNDNLPKLHCRTCDYKWADLFA